MKKNLYDILGVSPDASLEDIKRAYRKKAMKYHPDRNQGDKQAEAQFKEVQGAYDILGNEEKRAHYDRFGDSQSGFSAGQEFGGAEFKDLFSGVFEQFFGGRGFGGSGGGRFEQTLRYSVPVTLRQAACGEVIKIRLPESLGGGMEEVKLPPGVRDGEVFLMSVKKGCQSQGIGRVELHIQFATDQNWKLHGDNVLGTLRISYLDAILGGNVEFEHFDGRKLSVGIPVGSNSHSRLRIRGEGWPAMSGKSSGDLFLELLIEVPKKLSAQQKKLLEQLKKE